MQKRLVFALAACALLLRPDNTKAEEAGTLRPFTVGDLLKNETVGEAVFVSGRDTVIFEREKSLSDASVFSSGLARKGRRDLYRTCTRSECSPEPLINDPRIVASWMGPFSPEHSKLALFVFTDTGLGFGVYDVNSEQTRLFDIAPHFHNLSRFNNPTWLTDDTLLIGTMPKGGQSKTVLGEYLSTRALHNVRQDSWNGKKSSATSLRSGSPLGVSSPMPAGELVLLNVATGEVDVLLDGVFVAAKLSRDQRFLAMVQDMGRDYPNPDRPVTVGVPFGRQELIIYDLHGSIRREVYRCSGCSVLESSLSWSQSSNELLFFGRLANQDWRNADYYQISTNSFTLKRSLPDELNATLNLNAGQRPSRPAHWVGDFPLILAKNHDGRLDWRLIKGGVALPVTDGLSRPPPTPFIDGAGMITFFVDGGLWRIENDQLRLITQLPDEQQSFLPIFVNDRTNKRIPLIIDNHLILNSQSVDKKDALFFLNLETGTTGLLSKAHAKATVLDINDAMEVGLFLSKTRQTQSLLISNLKTGQSHALWSFNDHLKDIASPEVISLEYKSTDGESLKAFLLLPANSRNRRPLPAIVENYPWVRFGDEWESVSHYQLWSLTPSNVQVYLGAGYAVLLPSLPAPPLGSKHDPLPIYAGSIIPALEVGIAQGYLDPDRIGISGASYGSYTTASILTQTNMFRAAITEAHTQMNLFSAFGQIPDAHGATEDMYPYFRWGFPESLVRAPPWDDPDSYIKNSPQFHVDDITTPWLLIQGDIDRGGGLGQAEEMFSALARLGKEAEFVRYWGEGHYILGEANLRDYWRRKVEWLNYYLNGGVPMAGAPPE